MVTAVILLQTKKTSVNEIAENISNLPGVREVYSVAGRWDLVATVWVKDHDAVAEVVTDKILKIDGITKSETLISFRVYSQNDQDSIFSAGMDNPSD